MAMIDPATYEEDHVHAIYREISHDFDQSRVRVWKTVRMFIESIPESETIVELGCGNGKNLIRPNTMTGFDMCSQFIDVCKQKGLTAFVGDALNVKMGNESFHHALSVAVIHHFSTAERRIQAIRELARLTKPKGKILIVVWAMDTADEFNKKKIFESQDVLVPFGKKENSRYYHLYRKGELEEDCLRIDSVKIISSYYECGNYGVILEKQ